MSKPHKATSKVSTRKFTGPLITILIVAACFVAPSCSQEQASNNPEKNVAMDVLKGDWLRPDGDYTIAITGISADGQIEATYYNPSRA